MEVSEGEAELEREGEPLSCRNWAPRQRALAASTCCSGRLSTISDPTHFGYLTVNQSQKTGHHVLTPVLTPLTCASASCFSIFAPKSKASEERRGDAWNCELRRTETCKDAPGRSDGAIECNGNSRSRLQFRQRSEVWMDFSLL